MLGKNIKVRVTAPIGFYDKAGKFRYKLNYGKALAPFDTAEGVYIMGIKHPVKLFDGKIIAVIKRKNSKKPLLVAAPKSKKFIVNDIREALPFTLKNKNCAIECLYEYSCGAVVFREIGGEIRFLLIKNNRSANWGFPKGHIEKGESCEETAMREVLEETGIRINIIPDFVSYSEYTIQSLIEKSVTIFLASTNDTHTIIQKEEIDDYVWLNFDAAIKLLRFDNDRKILTKAKNFLDEHLLSLSV